MAAAIVLVTLAARGLAAERRGPSDVAARAAERIDEATLRAHTRFLAHDLLEGRAPGSHGDRVARLYIRSHLEAAGLRPGAPDGSWFQEVPLLGVRTRCPDRIAFRKDESSLEARFWRDYIANSACGAGTISIEDAECVFVGYGIVAPEYGWNDYEDVDVRGRVVIVLNSDPADDPEMFGGKARLYYGRWDYKLDTAALQGAAAAWIIHTTPSASYPWQVVQTSWSGEQFELEASEGPRLRVQGWLAESAARSVIALAGRDLDDLVREAGRRTFRAIPLGVRLDLELEATARKVTTGNVLGILDGSDPELSDEAVVFTAHHDHLGVADETSLQAEGRKAGEPVDRIYNGALDNASGVAALLALAKAYASLPVPPRRSLLFAAVAAEEQGLLGSRYLAAHPPFAVERLVAVVNIDGVNILGRTRDLTLVGMGKSSLDAAVEEMAAWQGRAVKPDPFPDRGAFYRSDQYSFARVGVPGVYLGTGTEFVGRPDGWGEARIREWIERHYHDPSDEYRDDWNLEGAVEDLRLLFHVGNRIADAETRPTWSPRDEFAPPRAEQEPPFGGRVEKVR